MAPEALSVRKYTAKSDVYVLSVLSVMISSIVYKS